MHAKFVFSVEDKRFFRITKKGKRLTKFISRRNGVVAGLVNRGKVMF